MRTLQELLKLMDSSVEIILIHKMLDKEKFLQVIRIEDAEKLYDNLQKAKTGLITISYLDGTNKHSGFTAAFGENLACRLSNEYVWYTTSTIQKIDWESSTFKTLNSVYKFEFEEVPIDEALEAANRYYEELIKKNEGKNKETE